MVSAALRMTVRSVALMRPCLATLVTEVVITAVALVFPRATRRDRGGVAPVKPARATVTAAGALQLSVTVAVASAPPGTDAGDSVSPFSAGWHVAAPAGACDADTKPATARTRTIAMRFMPDAPRSPYLARILHLRSNEINIRY
jgi:hypothetical protein